MSRPLRIFLSVSITVFSVANTIAGPGPKGSVLHVYQSKNTQGLIGVTEESPADNPADNIFHVNVDRVFCSEDNVWLEYELDGVEDHTSVSRSINDNRAIGGHLVKKRRGWALQQERIDGAWLRKGDNVIRFTLPEGARHSYRVRNLKLTVATNEESSEPFIINQPSKNYYDKVGYFKGFFLENNKQGLRLKVDGKLVPIFKGEFESEVAMTGAGCSVEMELIFPDGTTQCKSISYEKMENADFHYVINSTIFYKEQFIDQAKSDSVSLHGANLKLVSGALSNSSFLSITTLRDIDIPALDAGMVNVTANHYGFRFLPHGTQFRKEGKLKIPFDATKIPDGYTDKDIRTYFFDEQTHHWVALSSDTLLANSNEVVSRIAHFTDYINAIIKVPETPEVEAYNSTSMKGIKAANPTAGINLISPPQANNTGSASLSYPINIPAGRNGMQPQLAITYNSAGGNGWLGLGWNLNVPSIGIETRWGAPRYDAVKETETYTMNGEMLTPVAHRGVLVDRNSAGDKIFHPRIEGAFQRIKRHGNSPSTYWWEVIDKSGTRYIYGGTSIGNAFEKASVLRTNETNDGGNVAHWALSEVIDLNGNFVKYHYAKVANKGVSTGSVLGYQLYVDYITYTGHNGVEGKYKIAFTRDQSRQDVIITGNLGLKEVTGDRLTKIEVQLNDGKLQNVRSYVLNYKTGAFLKSLLVSIQELDSKGNLFNTHTFDYFDEVNSAKGYSPLFKESKTYNTFQDNINGGFLNKGDFNDNASILSGSQSSSIGAGLSVTLGPPGSLVSKTASAGINYAYSHSSSEGRSQMIDLNGDGLSDKVMVFKQGTTSVMKYRPQIKTNDGSVKFGELRPVNGINGFLKEESNSNDFGLESHFGIFAGLNENLTKSKTTSYFTDANGDGLIDVVINQQVKFNRLDQNGDPTFTDDSSGTPNRLETGSALDGTLIVVDPNEIQKIKDQNPMLDVVRMWRAPFDGVVNVTAPIALIQDFSADRQAYTTADGVRAFVQLRDQILWQQDIGANDYAVKNPTNVTGLTVKKNDKLYFRVNAVEDGSYDKVNWSPVVQYTQHNDTIYDANKKFTYKFGASEDFILAAEQNVGMPISGKVMIESTFVKPITSDSVTIDVILVSGNTRTTLVSKKYRDQDNVTDPINYPTDVSKDDQLIFQVTTSSNIKWESIQWQPLIYYTASYDPSITQLQDDKGNPQIKVKTVPQYSVFAETVINSTGWKASQDDTVTIKPIVHFKQFISYFPYPIPLENLFLTVKKENKLMGKIKLSVLDTLIIKRSLDSLRVPVKKGEKLYFDYTTDSRVVGLNLSTARVQLNPKKIKSQKVDAGLFTTLDPHDKIFGPQYRGWGAFAYNGNDGRNNQAIDQGKLNVDNLTSSNPPTIDLGNSSSADDMKNNFSNSGGFQANKSVFSMMYANGNNQRWMGSDDQVFVRLDTLSTSRMGMDQISALFPELSQGAGTAFAVDKITKSDQTSLAAGAGPVGANGSTGSSRVITDYMDMNGDRYPDILGQYKIQYTLPQGGLEQNSKATIWENGHLTNTSAGGASIGGGFPKSGKEASGGAKSAAFSAITQATSINVSASFSHDDAQYSWLDINGDGLPDRVSASDGMVALNLGYSFTAPEQWPGFKVRTGDSESFSGGLGISIADGSIQGGVGISRSDNTLSETLQDVNGDGLVDKVVTGSNGVSVYFGTGAGFDTSAVPLGGIPKLEKGAATSLSANAAFTFGIPLVPPFYVARILFNPHVSGSESFNRQQMMLSDVDGDGFPDYLQSSIDSELKVANSAIGRTNLLKSVQRPLGALFAMNYHRMGNTYNLPHNVWVLDEVKVFDGFVKDGADTVLTTFDYDNGIYDRHERDNYGFATVTTQTHDTENNNMVYTTVKQTYANNNYYSKGLLLNETMTDGLGRNYVVKKNQYDLKDIKNGGTLLPMALDDKGNAFPALTNAIQQFFEGQPSAGKTTSTQYVYDSLGNVVTYTDNGDEGAEDDLVATIAYYYLQGNYIAGTPKSILVKNGNTVLRKREALIDQSTGEVVQIKQYLDDNNVAVHDMLYDSYGNLVKMTRPINSAGQRLSINYVYDATVDTYPTSISNSYGYSSAEDYDFRFGEKISSTDLNGNKINYTLDDVGRVATVVGPYENGGGSTSNYTIKFQYFPDASVPYALTNHFDPQNPKNDLQTSIFVDGLGRVLQTKKDVTIFNGDGKADTEMMSVSGRVTFDAFGRTASSKYPTTQSIGKPEEFVLTPDDIAPTLTTYDVMNRTLTVTLPDKSVTKTEYSFGSDRDGKMQHSTKTTDANGKQTEQFSDVRGRVTSVKNYTGGNAVWTSFKYNAINEQIEATDDLKHTTFSTYDNLGRRTVRNHPDAGTTTYTYDLAGNLNTMVTANLAAVSMAINYTYEFERLTQITYPQNPENNVKYTYGASGAGDNQAGRIVLQEDATGAQEFFYGKLGEVVKNVRTVVIPQHDEQTFITEWTYDTWNRLTSMVYPDGETVSYNYNAGGLLHDMSGKKKSSSFAYINQLGYDKFEQRVFLAYGNGTKTTYSYEDDRRRLKSMNAQTSGQRAFMDNQYTYDKVNNILDLKNNAPVPSTNLMGGPSEYKYSYDDLYRLTNATGNYKGANDDEAYTLAMNYNSVGSILTKNQNHTKRGNAEKKTTYNNSYAYGNTQPHAPIHIGKQTYTYDANGNQLGWKDDVSGQRRNIIWDEENRIRAIEDNGAYFHYVYDANGERVLKGQSSGQRIFTNGQWKGGHGQMGNYTVYVNPYIVLNSGGYTKHFYIEGQRIVSKLGGGWDNSGQGPIKQAGNGKINYSSKAQQLSDGIVKNLKFLGADGQILTAGKSGKVPPGQVNGTGNVAEAFRYFFHPDHLGSTSYVTDASGEVYQHLEYFAFGETFVEEHSNTNRTPYLFNGKELDEETGLYYYGARYYDPKTSVWQNVDPKAEKGPQFSPYSFSFNNPTVFVDNDGNWPTKVHEQILRRALEPELKSGKLTEKQVRAIIKGSKRADNPFLGNQSDARQYMHAEKPKKTTVEEAIQKKNEFIKQKEAEFLNSKDEQKGLVSLGMALHPIMDENSPAHGTKNPDGTYTPTEYVKPFKHAHDENPKNIDPAKMEEYVKEAAAKVRVEYLKVMEQKKAQSTNQTTN